MLDVMSFGQFTGWLQYAALEPFGSQQDDFRAGQIAQVTANCNRDSKRTPKPFTASDFFPRLGTPKSTKKPMTEPGDWQKTKSMFKAMARRKSK